MQNPQLIEVDPQKIKFTKNNPRKHQGSEFDRLKQSVRQVGIVQLPTVRVLPGGFYECIDGEGRIRSAQEAGNRGIWVVSRGIVDDNEAMVMLQAANSVRDFNFLADCRGLANLHRQGLSTREISTSLGIHYTTLNDYIAIGYYPDHLQEKLQNYIANEQIDDKGKLHLGWMTLNSLLPLRQLIPGQQATQQWREGTTLDGVYDYTEVEKAAEKIMQKDIVSREQLSAYIERRRRELFEERFSQELQQQLRDEMDKSRQALEASYEQKIEGAEKKTAERYAAQVAVIQKQNEDLESQYQKLVREVARRPEIIEQREKELAVKLKEADTERNRFTELKAMMQQEQAQQQALLQQQVEQSKEEARKSIQAQLDAMLKQQRAAMDEQLAQTKADIEAYYSNIDAQRQLKAETSLRQAVAHQTELLSQTQQSFFHLLSPGFVKGIAWLSQAEVAGLLAQIVAMQETLNTAKETIQDTMNEQTTVSEAIEGGRRRG